MLTLVTDQAELPRSAEPGHLKMLLLLFLSSFCCHWGVIFVIVLSFGCVMMRHCSAMSYHFSVPQMPGSKKRKDRNMTPQKKLRKIRCSKCLDVIPARTRHDKKNDNPKKAATICHEKKLLGSSFLPYPLVTIDIANWKIIILIGFNR